MPIIEVVGGSFTNYGVDGEDLGWVEGTVTPTVMACNPHGITQAGVHSLLLDACMNFAINAALPGKARTRGTLEMKTETMRPAMKDITYALRGEVVRMAKQVAYGEATVRDGDGVLMSRATGTFLLHRPDSDTST
jgi:acyl-coenzyme A thioesterase PaaI-like protein